LPPVTFRSNRAWEGPAIELYGKIRLYMEK
jgi:hypothetical protein